MASKTKPSPSKLAFDDKLISALNEIGETEVAALVFGYLSAKQHGVSFGDPPDEDPFCDFTVPQNAEPEFGIAGSNLLSADTFVDASALLARDPVNDIIACIFAAFNRKNIPITTSTTPSSVFTDRGAWTGVALQIFACVAKKYPKFAKHAKPASADRFWNTNLEAFARAIHKVAV